MIFNLNLLCDANYLQIFIPMPFTSYIPPPRKQTPVIEAKEQQAIMVLKHPTAIHHTLS